MSLEWTDRADHPAYADLNMAALFFDMGCLLELAELVRGVRDSRRGGVVK